MGSEAVYADRSKGRRASKELYLPVLPGAWALGDGLDVQLLEELRSRGRAQSPPPSRQSGNESPSVWSSLVESLTGALDLSGGWEYSRSDSNRLASRGGGIVSAGGGGASGADGVVVINSGSRNASRSGAKIAGGGLLHRSCSTSVVPSAASTATATAEAPALLGHTISGPRAACDTRHYGLRAGGLASGGCGGTASARTSTCGLPSTATSSSTGMSMGLSSCLTTSASTPTAGRSARSSGSGCAAAAAGSGAVTFEYLASLPASGCADRDLIDSVLASPRGGLGVPAQVSVCKQD